MGVGCCLGSRENCTGENLATFSPHFPKLLRAVPAVGFLILGDWSCLCVLSGVIVPCRVLRDNGEGYLLRVRCSGSVFQKVVNLSARTDPVSGISRARNFLF